MIDYPIPANDDAIKTIALVTSKIADAVLKGSARISADVKKAKQKEVVAKTVEKEPVKKEPVKQKPEKKPQTTQIPQSQPANQELVNYIKQGLEKGMPQAKIRAALLQGGWKADDIDMALREATK